MKYFFYTIFFILAPYNIAHAKKTIGSFEVITGGNKSTFELYSDKTYVSKRSSEKSKTGKLNEKNFKYFYSELSKRRLLTSYPTKGCLHEKISITVSSHTSETCLQAKNKTSRSLVELSNRVRFLF